MAKKRSKKPTKAAGGKREGARASAHATPRTALVLGSPVPSAGSTPAAVTPPPTPPKQRWIGLPPNSKIRAKAAAICAMKIQGHDNDTIATQLGLSVRSLRQYLWIAGKNGWLKTDDPHEYAESVIIHKVVKGLEELVDARDKDGLPRQSVIMESAAGLGIFKDHSKQDAAPVQQANVLTINVVMPDGVPSAVRPGTGGGVPSYVEGETVGA